MALFTRLDGGAGNDTLTGTTGADVLNGIDGNDRLNGGDGADILTPGSGTNQIDAGAGDDVIVIDGTALNGPMTVPANGIVGGAGFDTVVYDGLSSGYHITQVAGGALTVTNLSNASRDVMTGVEALRFTDLTLNLGAAAIDLLVGSFAGETLTGGDTGETFYGLAGNDRINAAGGNDTINAGSGTNQIDAGAGDDLILIDGSASNGPMSVPANGIVGGDGYDSVAYSGASTDYHITQVAGGFLTVTNLTNGSRDVMTGVERLVFSDTELVLVAPNTAPAVSGPVQANVTEGATPASIDALAMASDVDGDSLSVVNLPALPEGVTFDAASQSFVIDPTAAVFDSLNDGQSVVLTIDYGISDGAHVTAASAVVTINGVTDLNLITGTAQNDRLTGTTAADDMQGLAGNDSLTGGAGNDLLNGGIGADSLIAGAGDDRVIYDAADKLANGGTGIDTLIVSNGIKANLGSSDQISGDSGTTTGFENIDASAATAAQNLRGSAGDNALTGGSAADTLQGGRGADQLWGGAGADRFVFTAANESNLATMDSIGDFTSGSDLIDLKAIDAVSGGANNALSWIGAADFIAAGQLRFDAASGILQGDVTGDGIADFAVQLQIGQSLTAADFVL